MMMTKTAILSMLSRSYANGSFPIDHKVQSVVRNNRKMIHSNIVYKIEYATNNHSQHNMCQ